MPKEVKNKEKKVKTANQKGHYFKDTKAELKKVIWPTPKELANNTLAVISIVILIGVIVFVLDFAFNKINQFGVDKLKAAVQASNTVDSTDTNAESNNDEVEVENSEANTSAVNAVNEAVENAQ